MQVWDDRTSPLDVHMLVQGVHMMEQVDDMARVGGMLVLDGVEHKDLSTNQNTEKLIMIKVNVRWICNLAKNEERK